MFKCHCLTWKLVSGVIEQFLHFPNGLNLVHYQNNEINQPRLLLFQKTNKMSKYFKASEKVLVFEKVIDLKKNCQKNITERSTSKMRKHHSQKNYVIYFFNQAFVSFLQGAESRIFSFFIYDLQKTRSPDKSKIALLVRADIH